MIQDPLLDTRGDADSLTIERSVFHRRRFSWKEGGRSLVARLSWDDEGRLTSREEEDQTLLYAYDAEGRETACYTLDTDGNVLIRDLKEWGDGPGPVRRRTKKRDSPDEEVWTCEYDQAGRMLAERRGDRVRVEKRDAAGRPVQEYLYDGETPDLVTDYGYDEQGRLISITTGDPDGRTHRREQREYDEDGYLSALRIEDSAGRILKDETYAYGAVLGECWLERVTWIPDGGRRRRRRPSEVIYRSFTLRRDSRREDHRTRTGQEETTAPSGFRNVAFANGIYTGPLVRDRPEGQGVFRYNDESVYRGEFSGGVMSGPGELMWPDGRRMEGRFSGGLLNGRGTCTWTDGSRYEGEFLNGRMHGAGVFTWADGTRFEGLFEKGRRTDQGAWEKK